MYGQARKKCVFEVVPGISCSLSSCFASTGINSYKLIHTWYFIPRHIMHCYCILMEDNSWNKEKQICFLFLFLDNLPGTKTRGEREGSLRSFYNLRLVFSAAQCLDRNRVASQLPHSLKQEAHKVLFKCMSIDSAGNW